jgi:hypothetical protein
MKKTLLVLILSITYTSLCISQSTIEFLGASASTCPSGSGPLTSNQLVTFYNTASSAFNPTVTATYSISNQQFLAVEGNGTTPGTNFGATISDVANAPIPASNIYDFMNVISGSSNTNYTACPTYSAGTGIDITANRSIQIFNCSDALINASGTQLQAYSARVQYADLTITFNRPVSYPMLHFTGLGGHCTYNTNIAGVTTYYDLGFTTDIDIITPGISWTKASGNAAMAVTSTSITNNNTRYGSPTTPAALHGVMRGAATGTVQVNAVNLTTISLRLFLKGDGGIIVNNSGTAVPANNGNIIRWAFHNGFIPGGSSTQQVGVSGDAFLLGISFLQPVGISGNIFNDPNGSNVNNSTGSANNIPAGLYANLIDSGGKVVASTAINPDGSYNFPAIFAGNYNVNLSTLQGVQGLTTPTSSLPQGWVNTGEYTGTPNTGNDGTVNGYSEVVNVVSANIPNINFGIQRVPETAVNTQILGVNPGGTINTTVNTAWFTNSNISGNLNTQDYDGGSVDFLHFTAFPTNATSIRIGNTTYYPETTSIPTICPSSTCATWPVAGVIISAPGGAPSQAVTIDPLNGAVSVIIPISAIDNQGAKDPTPGSITLTFSTILPVTILSFTPTIKNGQAVLNWVVGIEDNVKSYEVEFSEDGNHFLKVGTVSARAQNNYSFTHADMLTKTSFFRLKILDKDNSARFSEIKKIIPDFSNRLKIYPTPASDIVKLSIGEAYIDKTGQVTIQNTEGKLLASYAFQKLKSTETIDISRLSPGIYMVQVSAEGKYTVIKMLIKR